MGGKSSKQEEYKEYYLNGNKINVNSDEELKKYILRLNII
jgi:hypothetical protein